MRKLLFLLPMIALALMLVTNGAASAQQGQCSGAPPTRFSVGARGAVTPAKPGQEATPVRVRDHAGLSGNVVAQLYTGDQFVVTDGPRCTDRYLWWQIATSSGISGWVAEGDTTNYFIDPIIAPEGLATFTPTPSVTPTVVIRQPQCPNTPSTRFAVGLRGKVKAAQAGNTPNSARIRDKAGLSGKLLANLAEEVLFTVIGGPECANDFVWWQIKADNGISGWVAEGDIQSGYFIMPVQAGVTQTPVVLPNDVPIIQKIDCPGALPTRLAYSVTGVVAANQSVRVHLQSGIDAPIVKTTVTNQSFTGSLQEGDPFTIIAGPECVDNRLWWEIQSKNVEGWVAESEENEYLLTPTSQTITATPAPTLTPKPLQAMPTFSGTLVSSPTPYPKTTALSTIWAAAFSPNGHYLVTGHQDTALRLWDTATGGQIRFLQEQTATIRSVAFSPDGGYVAAGADLSVVIVWEISTGRIVRNFQLAIGDVLGIAYSPDGTQIFAAGGSGLVAVLNVANQVQIRRFTDRKQGATSVQLSPDGKLVLVSMGIEGALFDAVTGRLIRRFVGHTAGVTSTAFSPDGKTVATVSLDYTIRLWSVDTAAVQKITNASDVYSIAFSHDGTKIIAGDGGHLAHIWDAKTGKLLQTFTGHQSYLTSVAFSPDDKTVLSASQDGLAILWDAITGKEIRRFPSP